MKNAIEIKKINDNKRIEYINHLTFDNLYSEINNRLENVSLFKRHIVITYEEMFEYLGSDIDLNKVDNKELKVFIDIILDSVVLKLKGLKYIVTPYYDPTTIFKHTIGIKIYWDPSHVPTGATEL
nr:MAG TPA: hypothetical protein [Caudoviricetes sp.]